MNKLLEAALAYQKKDMSVIPCHFKSIVENGVQMPLKRPIFEWKQFQSIKPSEKEITEWWTDKPNCNIGIVTGKISNIIVVDFDGIEAEANVKKWIPDNIITPYAKTPSGGFHYYFQYMEGLPNKSNILPKIDIRTDGGFIMCPPSKHCKGKYEWQEYSLLDTYLAPMPDALLDAIKLACANNNIYINNNLLKNGVNSLVVNKNDVNTSSICSNGNISQTVTKNHNFHTEKEVLLIEKGSRDEHLFHLANSLVKSGMQDNNILFYLKIFAKQCDPPFPEKELAEKFLSAKKRALGREQSVASEVYNFVNVTKRIFTYHDLYKSVTLVTKQEKHAATVALGRLVEEKIIERVGKKHGVFKRIATEFKIMDYKNTKSDPFLKIFLPFGLHNMVNIMHGNIILLSGSPNSGKTGFLLNIIKDNMNEFKINYFNSEMGKDELRDRLVKFDTLPLSEWSFNPIECNEDFHVPIEQIGQGEGIINIIDFLEVYEDFYKIGGMINDIYTRLKGAIAIIAIQKKVGQDQGVGGMQTLIKPRLALSMESGSIKIVKAKNWRNPMDNPNNKVLKFKIVQGCNFIQTNDWRIE
jgi:hypothetical protein